MTKSADPQRMVKVHKLTAELRVLQDRINQTIEQLCDLVGGQELAELHPPPNPDGEARAENSLTPSFLLLPSKTPYARNPPTGYSLGPDARVYSNYRKGLVQLVQQALPRHADSRYSLIFNYADFDGDLLSVVVDARPLMAGQPAGKARIGLVVETAGNQHNALYAKCAWRTGKKWNERTFEVRANQVSIGAIDIERFEPEQVQALDIHLLFNPSARGSIEIRRLTATMSVQAMEEEAPVPISVFEGSP